MGKVFYYNWRWSLKSSPEDLWAFASDTNSFNQVTGLPKVHFEEVPDDDGRVRRFVMGKMYGFFPMRWEEFTFEWVKPLRYGALRKYDAPFPMRSLRTMAHLHRRLDGGTDVEYEVWAEARWITGIPAVAIAVGGQSRFLFGRAFHQMDAFIQQIKPQPFATPSVEIPKNGKKRFTRLINDLKKYHSEKLVMQLAEYLQNNPVEGVTRMRPFALADEWDIPRIQMLELFLHAASLGLLDLSWDMLCPECRGAKVKVSTLADIPDTVHCATCNIDYTTDFEQSVEATFSLSEGIAPEAIRLEYCIGGPQTTPHVIMQQLLQPGENRTTKVPLPTGYYRLRAPRLAGTRLRQPAAVLAPILGQPWLTITDEEATASLDITIQLQDLLTSTKSLRPGEITLNLHNQTDKEQIVLLEDGTWSQQIATAADITALQVFRDLFSAQALRPGYTVSIKNLVVLFTDLKNSTSLYRSRGDAAAFGQVIDHFNILREVVLRHKGALVKTIGDAVMAVFRDPIEGLGAALHMQDQINQYNESNPDKPLFLKIGLHQGRCIAVNLNERLDYFGSTVNIAARLEGQSNGDDIVTSQAIVDDPAVQALFLQIPSLQVEPFTASLKGFDNDYRLYRIRR